MYEWTFIYLHGENQSVPQLQSSYLGREKEVSIFLMISKLSSVKPSSKRLISTRSLPAFCAKIERKQSSNHNEAL